MKKLFLITVSALSLVACDSQHTTDITIDKNNNGLVVVHSLDSFDRAAGKYHVFTMIKNTNKAAAEIVEVKAKYFDESGAQINETVGGPGKVMQPGDSAIVDNSFMLPSYTQSKKLPFKIQISVTDVGK